MKRGYILSDEEISVELQQTLNQIADKVSDRKDELIELLSNEQPSKSRLVDSAYIACTWWEGCYYCRDDDQQWHRVKCFK